MSFYTGFDYYYPGPAPRLTGPDLADVVRRFIDTDILRPSLQSAKVVLQDTNYQPISPSLETMLGPGFRPRPLPNPDPGYTILNAETIRASRWDRRLFRFLSRPFQPEPPPWPDRRELPMKDRPAIHDIVGFLDALGDTPLLFAHLILGGLPLDSCERLHVRSSENDRAVAPCDVGLALQSATPLYSLDSERAFLVGQLSFSVDGPGYCFPRTLREITDDIRTDPAVTPLLDILHDTWPTEPQQLEHARDLLSQTLEPKLWPYDNIYQPTAPHWVWGMQESG